jgi:hypothetical protein
MGTHGLQTRRSKEVQKTTLDMYGAEAIPWSYPPDQLRD